MSGLWSAGNIHAAPASAQPSNTDSLSKATPGLPRLTTRPRARNPLPTPATNILPRLGSQRLSTRLPNRAVISRINIINSKVGVPTQLSAQPGRPDAGRPGVSQGFVYIVPTDGAYAYHKDQNCRTITADRVADSRKVALYSATSGPTPSTPCKVCYGERSPPTGGK